MSQSLDINLLYLVYFFQLRQITSYFFHRPLTVILLSQVGKPCKHVRAGSEAALANKFDGWYNLTGEQMLLGLFDRMSTVVEFSTAFKDVQIRRPLMASLRGVIKTVAPFPYKGNVSKHSLFFLCICLLLK